MFLCVYFCEKKPTSLICLEGKSVAVMREEYILLSSPSQLLPFLGLGPFNGFLSWHSARHGPSTSTRTLLHELETKKVTNCCAELGVESGDPMKLTTADANTVRLFN